MVNFASFSSGIDGGMSVLDFCALLSTKTGVAPEQQELLAGFPPKLLQVLKIL